MIPRVELIPLATHLDERGYFREILKSSQLPKFGQWSMSWMTHGTIKAWHLHAIQTDYWFIVSGVVKAVVCDLRRFSPEVMGPRVTMGIIDDMNPDKEIMEHILGDHQTPQVLVIPPGVAHGLKVLQGPAVLMYITSEEYNPKDEGRIPYDALGYDWDKIVIK